MTVPGPGPHRSEPRHHPGQDSGAGWRFGGKVLVPLGIRTRITALFVAVVLMVVALGATAFLVDFSSGLGASVRSTLRQRAERILHDASARGRGAPESLVFTLAVADSGQSVTQLIDARGAVSAATPAAGRTALVAPATIRRGRRTDVFVERTLPGRGHWLLLATPGLHTGEVLVTGEPLDTLDDAVGRAQREVMIAGVATVLAAAVAGWLLTGWALRPVERLRAEAQRIAGSDTDRTLRVPPGHDELARLATTLNDLILRWRRMLLRQRELVTVASHELRSPLAALHTQLELARRTSRTGGDVEEALERALARSRQLGRLATDLLLLAESDEGVVRRSGRPRPAEPPVAAALDDWRARADARDIMLALDVRGAPQSVVDDQGLRHVVDNLLANAVRFAPPGTVIEVGLARAGEWVSLRVRDRGPGFPPDFLPLAFDRFSRASPDRGSGDGGAGLGLAIVRAVAEAHGGRATAVNLPEGGAAVTVELPGAAL